MTSAAFGAVMTTDVNAGQVRGPIQLTFSRSLDPVVPSEFAITRCAVTNEKDRDSERTIGRKFNVPYGLYGGYGFLNAALARQTGFDQDDLQLFKAALNEMFDIDRSAARGLMSPVRRIAFRHEKATGNARADELFDMVPPRSSRNSLPKTARRAPGTTIGSNSPVTCPKASR